MKLGLFYRLLSGLLVAFLISTGVIAYMVIQESQKFIEKTQLEQAVTLVSSLAEGSIDALVVKDYELLERWLKAATPGKDYAYAYLGRSDGVIISHTDIAKISRKGEVLGQVHELIINDSTYLSRPVREVTRGVYLADQHLANVHLAYFLDGKNKLFDRIVEATVILQVIAVLLLLLAAFFILRWAMMPIRSLVEIIQRITCNQDYSLRVSKYSKDEVGVLVDSFNYMLDMIQMRDKDLQEEKENAITSAKEVKIYADELEYSNNVLIKEISDRIDAEKELKELSETLEEKVIKRTSELESINAKISAISRSAGMAEVASGVLHNVGNVLNSVNVSTSVIRESIHASKLKNLEKIVALLDEHHDDIADYIASDEKGSEIPHFISLLSEKLKAEQKTILDELNSLDHNITHIKNIIQMQQSYAGNYGVLEMVDLKELLEDSLKINLQGLEQCDLEVIRQYDQVPTIYIDKHKVMQVLINLISNAKHAMVDNQCQQSKLYLRLFERQGYITIEVEDTGIGISEEDISHIFEYGFKKRKGGHGFGLHNSALVAHDIGGEITVNSDGPGKGACFGFTLPLKVMKCPGD